MYKVVEKNSLWVSFKNSTDQLKNIYINSKCTTQAVESQKLLTLIDSFNKNRAYRYKSLPKYKFYFLSYYLVQAVDEKDPDLLGFINFLFKNGASLDGLSIIKGFMVRALFKEPEYFDLFVHCFDIQQFKLDEPLKLISYNKEKHFPILQEMVNTKKHLDEIERKFINGKLTSDDEIRALHSFQQYFDELLFEPNACIYQSSDTTFFYFDDSGRLDFFLQDPKLEEEVSSIINMGSMLEQGEVIASPKQELLIKKIIKNNSSQCSLQEHPIYFVQAYPESIFSVYFFKHCAQMTMASETALMVAMRFGAYHLMTYLLNKGASVHEKNNRNEDALAIAIQLNDIHAVRLLLSHRASILPVKGGMSAFHVAALYHNIEMLGILAGYAQLSLQRFGTLFTDKTKTLFHWMMEHQLLTAQELVCFLAQCDSVDKNNMHGEQIEQIIYHLYGCAYKQNNFELMNELNLYLLNTRYQEEVTLLIIKLMSIAQTEQDEFCDERMLQVNINDLFVNEPHSCSSLRALKLALFVLKQNQPQIADSLITHYKLSLKSGLSQERNFLYECIASRAYASALWLIDKYHGCPQHGFEGLDELLTSRIDGEEHYGHQLVRDKHDLLINMLLSRGCFDLILRNPSSQKGTSMIGLALITNNHSIVLMLLQRAYQLNEKQPNSELIQLNTKEEQSLFINYIDSLQKNEGERVTHLIPMRSLAHFAYSCFRGDLTFFRGIVLHFKLDLNEADKHGKPLLYYLFEELQGNRLTLVNLLLLIRDQALLAHWDAYPSRVLLWACAHGQLALVKECVDINNRSWCQYDVFMGREEDNLSALDLAYLKKNDELFLLLWFCISQESQKQHINHLISQQAHRLITSETKIKVQDRLDYLVTLKIIKESKNHKSNGEPHAHQISPITVLAVEDLDASETISCLLNEPKHVKRHSQQIGMRQKNEHDLNDGSLANKVIRACRNHNMNQITGLLKNLDSVDNKGAKLNYNIVYQEAIKQKNYALLQELLLDYCADGWWPRAYSMLKPMCYVKNSFARNAIQVLSELFKRLSLNAYLYGSALYSDEPDDFDILLNLDTDDTTNNPTIELLIKTFFSMGGYANKKNGIWGYKKQKRHVIPINWNGIQIEIVPTTLHYTEHAKTRVDMTLGAMYFNFNTLKMHVVKGIDAGIDLYERVIRTVRPAKDCFINDPKCLFRVARLMAKNSFYLSDECESAIRDIAEDSVNLFLKMNYDALCEQLRLILDAKSPEANIRILHEWNVLTKIIDVFLIKPFYSDGRVADEIRIPFLERAVSYSHKAAEIIGTIKESTKELASFRYQLATQRFFSRKTSKNQFDSKSSEGHIVKSNCS